MTTSDPNPYATPQASSPPVSSSNNHSAFFRDGKFLVVRDGAVLPERCLVTNKETSHADWRKRVTISWFPSWVFITILLNLIVMAVAMLITQKKAGVTYSLSREIRWKIRKKNYLGFAFGLGAIGLFVGGFTIWSEADSVGAAFLVGILLAIFSLICFVVANPLKAIKYKDGWFRLKGCSEEFLETLPTFPSLF